MEVAVTLAKWEKDIQEGRTMGLIGYLKMGRAITAIYEGNLFLTAGCKNIEEYGEKAHGMKKSSIYNAMAVWDTWGNYLISHPELQSVDVTRLVRLLPHLDGQDHHEMLAMACNVPNSKDFDSNIRNLQGKVAEDQCTHTWEPVLFERCAKCEKLRKGEK